MGLPPFLFSLVLSVHEVLSIAQAWKTAALYGSVLLGPSSLVTADHEVNFLRSSRVVRTDSPASKKSRWEKNGKDDPRDSSQPRRGQARPFRRGQVRHATHLSHGQLLDQDLVPSMSKPSL